MPFTILRRDITRMRVDAVVNAANPWLKMEDGVCGAIFQAAGVRQLQAACASLAPAAVGSAVLTPGFGLPARYILHAVGPVYAQYSPAQAGALLRAAYASALGLAARQGCKSVALPLISAGSGGFPKDQALRQAAAAVQTFLAEHEMAVSLVIYDRESFVLDSGLLEPVQRHLDSRYIASHRVSPGWEPLSLSAISVGAAAAPMCSFAQSRELEERLTRLDEPFNRTLLRLIDAKGKTDAEVYKRANIDRRLFSKIRTGKGYMPGKRTVLALAVALELTVEETDDLLERAGYALSHSQKLDVIVEYFILNRRYDIFEINQVLFQYDQPLLGAG